MACLRSFAGGAALLLALSSAACGDGTRYQPVPAAPLDELEPSLAADPSSAVPTLTSGGTPASGAGAASTGATSAGATSAGSSGPNSPPAPGEAESGAQLPASPPLRNPVALPDAELARQALTLLGSAAVGAEGSCRNCHSLGRPTLTRWSQLTRELERDCLAQPELTDQAAVDAMLGCLRQRSGKPAQRFSAESFGIYAAAAHLPWFALLFEQATLFQSDSPAPGGTVSHADLVARAGMPRAGQRWTQAEFDVVAEWFARRLPGLFELVPEDVGETCTPGLDPQLASLVEELSRTGWRARNAEVPLLMYGCAAGQSGSACLAQLPRASSQDFAGGWELAGTQIRLLHDNSQSPSAFWSRCSADGRYIGSGLVSRDENGFSGQLLDLAEQRIISANFAYDATFFPDNSGFLVQQGGYDDGSDIRPTDGSALSAAVALLCEQSVLGRDLGAPEQLTGEEPECTLAGGAFGLYQQTARALDGGDYWVAFGSYHSDNGGFSPVLRQPSAAFDAGSSTTLTSLLNDGSGFQVGPAVRIPTPHHGDPTLSPSGRLLVARVKGREFDTTVGGFDVVAAEQSGYALYAVDPVQAGGSASLRDLGRLCLSGSKATFSYDERWLIFHRYVTADDALELGFSGASDPAFAPYLERGASDLMLVDLSTGAARRITRMAPGQYALFPHFRSDGWIYFVVRTLDGAEWFAASDAALVLEQ